MEEKDLDKDLNEEEILDENITETTEDVDSLLKSAPQKINMKDEEMEDLFFRLMSCANHNYTADGRKIMEIMDISEIENKFN